MGPSSKLSGLQKDVLSLYRNILRVATMKDKELKTNPLATTALTAPSTHIPYFLSVLTHPESTVSYARQEFRRQAESIKRSDFRTVEYSIRKGKKHLKLMSMPGVKVVAGSSSFK